MKKNSTCSGRLVLGAAALLLGGQLASCSMNASFKAGGKDAEEPEQPSESESTAPAETSTTPAADTPATDAKDNEATQPDVNTDTSAGDATSDDQADSTPAPDADAPAASSVTVKSGALIMPGNLVFDSGAATLQAGEPNDQILGQLKAYLDAHAELTQVRVEGHTDNQGTAESNLELSGKRALAVKTWLVDHGVSADRILAVGFGQTKPIADNSTADGRAQNRRTEFKVAGKNGRNYLGRNPLGGGTEFK